MRAPWRELPWFRAENEPFDAYRHGPGGANRGRRTRYDGNDGEEREAAECGCIDRPRSSAPEHVLANSKRIALPRDNQKRHGVPNGGSALRTRYAGGTPAHGIPMRDEPIPIS